MRIFSPSLPPLTWILGLTAIEVSSFLGWVFPWLGSVILAYIVIRILIASLKDLRIGVIAVCVELVIGSQGYLFSVPFHGFTVSIRLALFMTVFFAGIVHMFREKKIVLLRSAFFPYLVATLFCVAYGVAHSLLIDLPLKNIFFDTNAWLFLGLALPFAQALRTREDVLFVFQYIFWGIAWLALITLAAMFFFSHPDVFDQSAPLVYRWLRDLRIAEIFRFPSGFARVFIQSQIFALFGFAILYTRTLLETRKPSKTILTLLGACMLTILLSYSRTFWLVSAAVIGLLTLYLVFTHRALFRQFLARIGTIILLAISAVVIAIVLVKAPLPGAGTTSGNLLTERVSGTNQEVAAVTRFQQLSPLIQAALKHPVFGSGFGSTIIYTSEDPKVRAEHPDGQYTTYAFEWAYLDLFYKIGFVGLAVIVVSLLLLALKLFKNYRRHHDMLSLGLCASLVILLGVHVLTPYINHPLGLGWILLLALYAYPSSKNV